MNNRGFTLIEMMIVVAILGIVSSYAMPSYMDSIVGKQIGEGVQIVKGYQPMIVEYYRVNGRFPANNSALGIPPPDKILGNYVTGVSIDNGAINITYGNYVHTAAKEKFLSIRPMVVTGSPKSPIGWSCGYREPPAGMTGIGENKSSVNRNLVPLTCR